MPWLGLALLSLVTPESIWVEAESFAPLKGNNFSFMREDRQTRGSWSIAGPDVAAAWTQGGESEFMSIAARADEPAGTAVLREVVVPFDGDYRLWVRYADYRGRAEEFDVRVTQREKSQTFKYGLEPLVDELDPMKLLWDWSYAWVELPCSLESGAAKLELVTTGPTGARRCVDCLGLTTDPSYRPSGRQKPAFASWAALAQMRKAGMPDVEPLVAFRTPKDAMSKDEPPAFLWNVGTQWADELNKPLGERLDTPFSVDPPLLKDFLAAFKGPVPALYADPSSGPVWYVPNYPNAFATGSPALEWLERHPQSRFAILLNYGEPQWPEGADRKTIRANLEKYRRQFVGFIAGENISYASVDEKGLEAAVRAAKTRGGVLAALRRFNTDATVAKFSDYFGTPLKPEEAWADVVSCLSSNNEAYCHALAAWGVRRIGHENTGNSPTLARRLAFLRGAARQFDRGIVDYQSANLGDSATMFSREAYIYPGTSRYILDNSYDAWAGAGTNWLLKDYLLWYLAGVEAFYNEQGMDMYWKPGGGSAGDDFPVQLSPKGKVAAAVQKVVGSHPRPVQFTPVAFLLDAAHGWSQERFQPGAFGLDPSWNPRVLMPGKHEASIRGWFDVAYYPAPETQNEPATAIRQTFVNGIFGDIFDVIVTAPGRTQALDDYPVVVAAGEVPLDKEWGDALLRYVQAGGTLVASLEQFTGSSPRALGLATSGQWKEASGYRWMGGPNAASATYRYFSALIDGRVLASTSADAPVATLRSLGKGQIVMIGVPLGLGIDERPVPFLGPLLQHLVQSLNPIQVRGDVEWVLSRLPDGGWLVGLFNNRGITKPQHGVLPTDHGQAETVTVKASWPILRTNEWMTGTPISSSGSELHVSIPAGAVRLIALYPGR